jgi:hypothetical protein
MDDVLVLPFDEDLTEEAGWTKLDKYLYFAARYHLCTDEEQTDEFRLGDVLRSFHTTDFTETEVVKNFEVEVTTADVEETTRTVLLDRQLSQKVTGTITGSAKNPLYELSAEVGTALEHSIRSSLEESIRANHSVSTRRRESFSVSQKIRPGARELQLAVAGYRKYTRKVFLHYMDYLFVEYRVAPLGLRKKKRNLPRPEGRDHSNRILVNAPLFKMSYWRLETESSLLFTENEYRQALKVEHPDRVTFEELDEAFYQPLPQRLHRPTLYRLSKIAFPVRWVDRQGPWTKQELERIELDEADGSAWWFQYGPGRPPSRRSR